MRCVVCTLRHKIRVTPRFHEFHITMAHWVRDMKLHEYTTRHHAKRWRMIHGFLNSPCRESVTRQSAQGGPQRSMVGLFSRICANENNSHKQLDNKFGKPDVLRGRVAKNKTADTMAGNRIPLDSLQYIT